MRRGIEQIADARRDEIDWVLSDNQAEIAQQLTPDELRERLTERYFQDYANAWLDFLNSLPGHKTVVLDCIPTAENLAEEAFRILDGVYRDTYGNHLQLERVRLYETPNCWVDAVRKRS